jgi:predicted HTH transcriptional regulator
MPSSTTTMLVITDEMKKKVIKHIKANGFITNRQCRDLLELGYDQVIKLFNEMIASEELTRIGKTTSVKYVLPEKKK